MKAFTITNQVGDFSVENDEQLDTYYTLLNRCKVVNCFEESGVTFKGNYVIAVKKYILSESTQDFSTWLFHNYTMININPTLS